MRGGVVTRIGLRPQTDADEAFLRAVYTSTRVEELAVTGWNDEQVAAFLAMQFEAQSVYYRATFADAAFDVIVVDGEDAGRLIVLRLDDEIRVVDIALLPAFRGRGVGASLLGDVIAEAAASGRRVVIHVERENPARSLYDRLGFVVVDEGDVYLRMEWTPASAT